MHRDISIFNMAYYEEGKKTIGVLIDFDLASYPEEMVNRILGLTRDDDKTDDAMPSADTTVNVTNRSDGTTSLNPYPAGACQDRSGTTPFMAIETLDLSTSGYKHHLSHDLESILYASVWHGVGYKYDQKLYPMVLMNVDGKEKESDLLRSWRVGSWDEVVEKKEAFLSAPHATTGYITYDILATTCENLAGLLNERRTTTKKITAKVRQLERNMHIYKKLSVDDDDDDDSDEEDIVNDSLTLARWAARTGLNAPEGIRSADVSK